jgi:hypothetical protein
MTASDRKILFVHIPRTAGISLNRALERWASPHRSLRYAYGGEADWIRYRALPDDQMGRLKLLSGHLGFEGFKQKSLEGWDPITVLREPVQRTLSRYTFVRGSPGHPWYQRVANMDLDTFLDWVAENPYSFDSQCQSISGGRDASVAFETLRSAFFLACTVEHLPRFLEVLSERLGTTLSLDHTNESADRIDPSLVADSTLAKVRAMNLQDDILYRRVLAAGLVGYGVSSHEK